MGHADQHHAAGLSKPIPVALDDGVFPFALAEFDPGNLLLVSPRRSRVLNASVSWPRMAGEAIFCPQPRTRKSTTPPPTLQPWDVGVEIQTVDAAHFQGHVVFDNLGNVGHDVSSWLHLKRYHPTGVRDESLLARTLCLFPHRVADRREAAVNNAT